MSDVPHLRFPEFSGEWEEHTLSEYLEFKNGLNPDAKRIGSGLPFISVMDILSEGVINYDNIRGKVNATEKEIECFGVKDGDLLFQRSSETLEDVGRANVYMDNRTAIYGGFVIRGRKIGNYDPLFFKYLLATPLARKRTCRMGAGAQHFNIGQEGLSKISLYFPSIEEQRKIAEFLSLIDERIATQNKIIEDLKKLKSAISLNVLHSDKWEQFKIKDIAQIGRGRVISSIEIGQQKSPTYPVYSSQTSNDGIMGYLDDYMFEGEYISWTTDGANAGTVFYRNGKFNCTNVCGLLKLRKEFDTHFVSLVLAEATKKYVSINLANPKLMNNTMGNIQIRLPKLEEQKRISIVFRVLQRLWTVHNSLLTEYTKQEQYLLSQMFI
ncbi:restriction endonuclease subunit S [Bacteroides thetaiotaomicron]|mgnify:CR=1 FL=1|uniref:Type I restriction enzyme specificity protein n=1 Tax=Bacteroides thetaiotaomicron (strain ATCC 29148 / DSM 2079 / JCM 5827 / CCUG 10774 / NCTC 10582 / VPI-5482 / E50) TaxID=226186 RepID=Q89Z34_BACTN|nr:restriction endonuclease subunit S [Bacteroides thetaiotaomicron]AAO79648.1 putative type I restriction enzyme specificity protein [Bacteroides thetaiotaomicron VPI-5482]MDC7299023.1 restriction endonuclease subunit S [Bacteroides thetaiotaomicron]PQL38656.1 restriction endonuclease subunit S [Bacteroides thetaiotaomicron]UML59248.1 restriction endonuclease subunit S [Bacteroides thetaiotaomicron]